MAAVEPDGDAQDAGERPHQALVVGVEGGELGVRRLRLALAVVAGDLGDDLDLEVGQPGQLAVADHVVGVQVVLAVGDDEADVGQQGAGLEVLAGRAVEVVRAARGASNSSTARRATWAEWAGSSSQRSASCRMLRRDTSRRWCRAAGGRRCAAQPLERVEEHAVAQRRLAERERLDAERRGRPSPGSARRRRRCRPGPARGPAPWRAPVAVRWRASSVDDGVGRRRATARSSCRSAAARRRSPRGRRGPRPRRCPTTPRRRRSRAGRPRAGSG